VISFGAQLAKPKNRFVAWIAVLAAIGGFLFGFDTGVVGSAEPYFSKALDTGTFGESWVVGSLLLGAVFGALAAGRLADLISRTWTKFVGGGIYTLAALGSAFAPTVSWLCIARFVLGLAAGTASFVAPMYISEQSPKHLRGGMTALNQVMITFGIMVAYLSDYALRGWSNNWRWMFGVEAVPGAVLAIAMVVVPHTPRWLIQQGRVDDAGLVMGRTRPDNEVDDELAEIKKVSSGQGKASYTDLFGRRLRPLLIVGCALAAFQQLVGVNSVIYFGATVLKFMGHTTDTAVYEAISLGIVNFVAALVAALLLGWGWPARTAPHRDRMDGGRAGGTRLVLLGQHGVPTSRCLGGPGLRVGIPCRLRNQPRPSLLAHDLRDLPAEGPRQSDGLGDHGQLVLQFPSIVLFPDDDSKLRQRRDLLAVRLLRSLRVYLQPDQGTRDPGALTGTDRAGDIRRVAPRGRINQTLWPSRPAVSTEAVASPRPLADTDHSGRVGFLQHEGVVKR
jgi:MFS family permease